MAEKLNIFVIVYLNDIFIYIEDLGQGHVGAVRWMLDILKKHRLFANLKKCWFHKDKVCFLGYVVLAQETRMEDKQIKAMKNWPKPTSVRDIQVFIGFANFSWRFIQGLSKIDASLTSILKTTRSSEKLAPKVFKAGNDMVIRDGDGRADETVVNSSKNEKSKKLMCVPNVGAMEESNFLTPNAKKVFN